jgi:HEAT repeat protein
MQMLQFGYTPGVSAVVNVEIETDPPSKSLKGFPKALRKALGSRGTKDHEAALIFVQCYAGFARTNAFQQGQKDLEAVTQRTFAPYTQEITTALARALDDRRLAVRWNAASALLAFEPDNAKANAILTEGAEARDQEFGEKCCEWIGMMHLSHKGAVSTLIRALRQERPKVRRSAANGAAQIGPEAKAAVPALIDLFEAGDVAYGVVATPFTLQQVREANLALLALSAIGADARAAVPVILRKFPRASEQEQGELLTCLARVGPAAKESIGTIEKAMTSEQAGLRLTAACALLCVVPEHHGAAAVINEALVSKDKKAREQALQVCVEIGPRSTALVPALKSALDDEDEDTRILGTQALGQIGPRAAATIPALEKLLIKPDDHMKHTCVSHRTTAFAMARMGKAAVPALIRATVTESEGREDAILALGSVGRDAQPDGVACLMRIFASADKKDWARFLAAVALGSLREHARSARRVLEASREDSIVGLAVEWALMEIPR